MQSWHVSAKLSYGVAQCPQGLYVHGYPSLATQLVLIGFITGWVGATGAYAAIFMLIDDNTEEQLTASSTPALSANMRCGPA